jgi:hypothetical protein
MTEIARFVLVLAACGVLLFSGPRAPRPV